MKADEIRKLYYNKAISYYKIAKDVLRHANISDNEFYSDKKYVKIACGVLYDGVLIALDGYLMLQGIELEENRDIDFYKRKVVRLDDDLFSRIDNIYILLRFGQDEGISDSVTVKRVFELAQEIMDYINPKD